MQNGLVTEAAQARMSVYNLDLFAYDDIAEHGKEGENRWKRGLAEYYEEWNMIHFQPVGEIMDSGPPLVCVRDDDDLVATVNQLCRDLINVTFNSPWLRKEEVTDHCNVVRHLVQPTGAGMSLVPVHSTACIMSEAQCDCDCVNHRIS